MKRRLGIDIQMDVIKAFGRHNVAIVAVSGEAKGFTLGIAERDKPGYSPINSYHYLVDTYSEAADEADRLNDVLFGIGEEVAVDIIASSMRAGKVA